VLVPPIRPRLMALYKCALIDLLIVCIFEVVVCWGPHRSWIAWKIMEFCVTIFQIRKVMEPTNSVKALKRKISHSTDLLTPSSPGGSSSSSTTNSSWLPWARVAMPLISPLMTVPQDQGDSLLQNTGDPVW